MVAAVVSANTGGNSHLAGMGSNNIEVDWADKAKQRVLLPLGWPRRKEQGMMAGENILGRLETTTPRISLARTCNLDSRLGIWEMDPKTQTWTWDLDPRTCQHFCTFDWRQLL